MANLRLKKEIIEVVDNQIKMNNPLCTKRTYERLLDMGFDRTTAKERIATVLLDEIYETLKNGKSYDEAIYEEKLNKLIETCDREYMDVCDENEDGPWSGLQELIWNGYEAAEKLQYDKMLENWLPAWQQVKTIVAGAECKPSIINLEEATDYAYEIYNWLQDMEMELGNAKEYEKRIDFCKEVIEIFAWDDDKPNNYKAAIGETMNQRGQAQECDTWYEDWLKEEPGNPACINSYIWCLIDSNDIDRAKELIEEYIDKNTEYNMENEILFIRAASLYKALGEEENASFYEKKLKTFHENFLANPLQYGAEDELSFYDYQPVVKDKKVYPNEPCPCGSGKKYKKCCGRS